MPRTGRRPGIGGTRDKILAAARARFGEEGYDGATIRGIASAAGVDPAMVPHYFGSKEGVFLAAVEFPVDPAVFIPRLLEPGLDGLGERLVSFFLETWDSPAGGSLLALIRSVVSSDLAADLMREFVTREVLGRLAVAIKLLAERFAEDVSIRQRGPRRHAAGRPGDAALRHQGGIARRRVARRARAMDRPEHPALPHRPGGHGSPAMTTANRAGQ